MRLPIVGAFLISSIAGARIAKKRARIDPSGEEDTFDLKDDRAEVQSSLDRQPVKIMAGTGPICASGGAGRRVVSMADQHGDFEGMLEHLQMLRLVNEAATRDKSSWGGLWAGGDAIFVQTGDILDRGPDGKLMYELLWALQDSAEQLGGQVVLLTGNHELMVLEGDIRYVTDVDFCKYTKDNCGKNPPKEASYCDECCTYTNDGCAKGSDCLPGNCEFLEAWDKRGSMGAEMRKRFREGKMRLVYKVNGVVFTHAGLVSSLWPKIDAANSTDPLGDLNELAAKFFQDDGYTLRTADSIINAGGAQGGPMWTRICYDSWYTRSGRRRRDGDNKKYYMDSDETSRVENGRCETIAASLKTISANRMVIGHCPQGPSSRSDGVETSCSGSLVMADTYMSVAYSESRSNSLHNLAALEFFSEDDSGRVWTVYSGRDEKCDMLP